MAEASYWVEVSVFASYPKFARAALSGIQDVEIGRRVDGEELKIQGVDVAFSTGNSFIPFQNDLHFKVSLVRKRVPITRTTRRLVDRTETNVSGLQCCHVTGPGCEIFAMIMMIIVITIKQFDFFYRYY